MTNLEMYGLNILVDEIIINCVFRNLLISISNGHIMFKNGRISLDVQALCDGLTESTGSKLSAN